MPLSGRTLVLAFVLSGALASASCNTTPTLPLPPPVASASSPDEQGFALIEGEAHALAYVSVLNERTEAGVITRADDEGRFRARIAAQIGDLLTIWQEVGGEVGELKRTSVPPPR
jgi:hypothetical protein